ncbi:MAG TPA: carbohydrate ABC transporter permease [Lachnoclostridium sp.]|nr:carbohydrate ABC transporter permease [Lachnoclostridium sp.]
MGVLLKRKIRNTILYAISIVIALITGFPFVFLLINSFKSMGEYLTNIWRLPKEPFFGNYQLVLKPDFLRYFLNSVVVSGVSVFIIVVVSSMISFTFARLKYRGRNLLYFTIIAGMMIPVHTTLIPTFTLLSSIGLTDTLTGLVGPYVSYNIPIAVFILTQFFREIPKELEEAAIIDGCSLYGVYSRVVLPLSKPILAVVALFSFRNAWNDYITSMIMTISMPKLQTLTVAVVQLKYSVNAAAEWHIMLAGASIAIIPILIVYLFANKQFIAGLTAGAVKG